MLIYKFSSFVMVAAMLSLPATSEPDKATPNQQPTPPAKLVDKASHGDIDAQKELGMMYVDGKEVPQNYPEAVRWLEKAANHGDPQAQVELGYLVQFGLGTKPDLRGAVNWYARAAASDFAGGQLNLGIMYMNGDGVRKDPAAGLNLLNGAARKGEPFALAYLGTIYLSGYGVPADVKMAETFFEAAAKKHNPLALYSLGVLFSGTHGHGQDPPRAEHCLRQALEQGFSPAAHSLGLLLVNHPDMDKRGEGVGLLQRAANEGNWRSATALGVLYRDGKLVEADATAAYRWFRIALIEQRDKLEKPLASSFALLQTRLSNEQRASLDREADEWVHTHPYHPSLTTSAKGHSRVIPMEDSSVSWPGGMR